MLRLSTGLRNILLGAKAELITNGGFATVTTGWTAVTATLSVASAALQIAESGGADPGKAYQDISTVIGRLYKLSFLFQKGTADKGKVTVGTTGSPASIYDSGDLTDAVYAAHTTYFIATAATTRITLESQDATVGETSLFDTVSCLDMAGDLHDIFNGCLLDIYQGGQPASADAAVTGTLAATIFSDGSAAPLHFDAPSAGTLSKAAAETWSGPGLANVTAGYFRLRLAADPGTLDSAGVWPRIDGLIAASGAEMDATSTTVVSAATQTVTSFSITLPANP